MDVKLWRKRHAAARVRREFRTAEEVLNEAAEQPAAAPRQAILDMRGPQVDLPPLLHLGIVHDQCTCPGLFPVVSLCGNA